MTAILLDVAVELDAESRSFAGFYTLSSSLSLGVRNGVTGFSVDWDTVRIGRVRPMFDRSGGLLLHITSLPGPDGIGDLGESAFRFVDIMAHARQRLWQVLPVGPPGAGNSPYDARSSFAGSTLMIDLLELEQLGLVEASQFRDRPDFQSKRVEFARVRAWKERVLRSAFDAFTQGRGSISTGAFEVFMRADRDWRDDFTLYQALRGTHGGQPWYEWESDLRVRTPRAVARWRDRLAGEVEFYAFAQYLFQRQWKRLRDYANSRGVMIMGDIPIYVARDSAEVWSNQDQFLLDDTGNPGVVAGVPPDMFSKTGQLWGNPCYDWETMARDGYRWWISRFRRTFELTDIVRVDHFRGFAAGWQVPFENETAIDGTWVPGPGRDLFDAVSAKIGELPIVVEDLGVITSDVEALRESLGYPGMKILQFAFNDDVKNPYLPHRYLPNCMVYTGTHDNDTTRGWFSAADRDTRRRVINYAAGSEMTIHRDLIRVAWASVADLACAPVQDVLGLGNDARMNVPGQGRGNWGWRLEALEQLEREGDFLRKMSETYDRSGSPLIVR
jgi:4-alpha-glucanotransferase